MACSPLLPHQLAVPPAPACRPSRTSLPFVRICNPHVCNIGICNPAIHYFAFQMLIIPAVRFQIRQNITVSPVPFSPKRPVLIPEAPRAYSRSAPRLFSKRLVLILEAPRAYPGSAPRLSPNRLALIPELPALISPSSFRSVWCDFIAPPSSLAFPRLPPPAFLLPSSPVFLLPSSSFLFPLFFFARVYIIYNVYMIKSRSF